MDATFSKKKQQSGRGGAVVELQGVAADGGVIEKIVHIKRSDFALLYQYANRIQVGRRGSA